MRVGVDHEANWLFCHRADRCKQAAPLADAAASVDDGNRVTADDKPHIRDSALIRARHRCHCPDVNR